MTEISYMTPSVRGFKDHSAMLLVVGILFIRGGCIAACGSLTTPLAMRAPQPAGQPPPSAGILVSGLVMYVAIAAVAITLGIGSIRKRRWVRPIVLVLSWI